MSIKDIPIKVIQDYAIEYIRANKSQKEIGFKVEHMENKQGIHLLIILQIILGDTRYRLEHIFTIEYLAMFANNEKLLDAALDVLLLKLSRDIKKLDE